MSDTIQVSYAFLWLERQGIRYPYGVGVSINNHDVIDITEEQWDAYVWNPPQARPSHTTPDPDASPKPTWEELVNADANTRLRLSAEDAEYNLGKGQEGKQRLTDLAALPDLDIYVGAGLDHMTGLLQIVENANEAGGDCPHIVMRNGDNETISVHRQAVIREILSATAARENLVESAHNAVMNGYHRHAKIRDDLTQPLDDRKTAADLALAIASTYETLLTEEMAKYDPDALPDDLDELKLVYVERLEAAALGKDKEIRGHLTNQGVMLHPSCFDQETALRSIAEAYFMASAKIRKARYRRQGEDGLRQRQGGD